ncbi:hypothetical protein AK830_g8426 [Neonectria ditissima]|uniref:Uncharacterized protein n=1 Tax=Neonectria ditissima TaxID=78410 RepID=A0A0P7AKI0_9HYPO|nr:hypothetical protein AK830_g8426 [Neonectria ditissima]
MRSTNGLPFALWAFMVFGFWVSTAFAITLKKPLNKYDMDWIIQKSRNVSCLDTTKVTPYEDNFKCAPRRRFKKGHCKPYWYRECQGYCEMSTMWWHGLESPFPRSSCNREPCRLEPEIPNQLRPTWNYSTQIAPTTFSEGSSLDFSSANMTTGSVSLDKPARVQNECGYWTFIPNIARSCGITVDGSKERFWIFSWCSGVIEKGECATSVHQKRINPKKDFGKQSLYEPEGEIVFVATDCDFPGKRLPFCMQHPTYLKKGVSIDPQVHENYLETFRYRRREGKTLKDVYEMCMRGEWPPENGTSSIAGGRGEKELNGADEYELDEEDEDEDARRWEELKWN